MRLSGVKNNIIRLVWSSGYNRHIEGGGGQSQIWLGVIHVGILAMGRSLFCFSSPSSTRSRGVRECRGEVLLHCSAGREPLREGSFHREWVDSWDTDPQETPCSLRNLLNRRATRRRHCKWSRCGKWKTVRAATLIRGGVYNSHWWIDVRWGGRTPPGVVH